MKETTTQRLNQLMLERGLKQVDILEKSKPYQRELDVKLGKSALSQYISGKSSPDQDKLVLLSKTLGVSEAWLLGFDVPREPAENAINGNQNNVATMSGDINGNVTFGSGIDKNDLHDAVRHLSDRELQEKILDEMSELKASQKRLENAIAMLVENQVNVLAKINNVDSSFKKLVKKD